MKAQMYHFSTWVPSTDPEELKSLESMLQRAGFGLEGMVEHHYEPQGYSCVYLLSESHLSVHTFPEENCSQIELMSCVKKPFNNFITRLLSTIEGG